MKCRNCKHNGFLTDEDGTQYSWCEVACDNLDVDEERRCAAFVKATHADRIRSMSDYDLAIFLENVSCKHADTEGWLDWLTQEVES